MLGSNGQGKKRFISLILCALMALSLMPDIPAAITPVAMAEDTVEQTNTEQPTSSETVVVASDPVNVADMVQRLSRAPASAQYTVTYVANGATYHTELVDADTLARGPADPTDTSGADNAFIGWYTTASGSNTTPFDLLTTLITGDLTLYARFSGTVGILRFRDCDYNIWKVIEVPVGQVATAPAWDTNANADLNIPAGETFAHWYAQGGDENTNYFTGNPRVTGQVTLLPKVSGIFQVAFSLEGGTWTDSSSQYVYVSSGDKVTKPASDPTRLGFDFVHWSLTQNGTTAYDFNTTVSQGFVLYAVWKANTQVGFTLRFNVNGTERWTRYVDADDYQDIETVLDETQINALVTKYWGEASEASKYIYYSQYTSHGTIPPLAMNGSSSITINCTRFVYTIIFDLSAYPTAYIEMNGTKYYGNSYTYETYYGRVIGVGYATPDTAHLDGMIMRQWKQGSEGIPISAGIFNDTFFQLPFPPEELTIVLTPDFVSGGDYLLRYLYNYVEANEVQLQTLEDESAIPTLAELTFEDGTVPFIKYNSKIYVWRGESYTRVTYIEKDGTYDDTFYRFNQDRTIAHMYQFSDLGWYTVKHNPGLGSYENEADKSQYLLYGSIIPTPPMPTIPDGYELEGWYLNSEFTRKLLSTSQVTGKMELFANVVVKTVDATISFYDELVSDTTPLLTRTVNRGQTYNAAGGTLPAGYTVGVDNGTGMGKFRGWFYTNYSTGVETLFDPTMPIDGHMELYARWTPVNYEVTFRYDPTSYLTTRLVRSGLDNSLATSGQPVGGGTLTAADRSLPNDPNPPSPGYVFAGWFRGENGTSTQYTAATRVTSDMTVYAHFVPAPDVTFTYRANNTTMGSVSPGSEEVAPIDGTPVGSTATAKSGYRFVNWTLNGTEVSTSKTLVPDASTKVDGLWTERTYTANFEALTNVTLTYQTKDLSSTMGTIKQIGTVNQVTETSESINPATGNPLRTTASPATGYKFDKWTLIDGTLISNEAELPLSALRKDEDGNYEQRTYIAHFASMTNVTLRYETANNAQGLVTDVDNATNEVNYTSESINPATGTPKRSTARPKPGYRFVNWTVDGTPVSTNATIQAAELTKDGTNYAAATYVANFTEEANVTLLFESSDTNMGTVTPASKTLPPATGTADPVTASAKTGYQFVNWTLGVGGTVVSTSATFTPTKLTGSTVWVNNTTYVANFKAMDTVTITYKANSAAWGTVTDVSSGSDTDSTSYSINPQSGTPRASTAKPADGYRFVNWTGPDGIISTNAALTAADIPKNTSTNLYETATYTANFALLGNVTLTYETEGRSSTMGQITDVDTPSLHVTSTSEAINPKSGVPKRSAAVPKPGYEFVGWFVGNTDITTNLTLLLANLLGYNSAEGYSAATYTAKFKEAADVSITFSPNNASYGSITGNTSQSVPPATGSVTQVVAVPKDGYEFVEWRLNGQQVSTSATFRPTKTATAVWDDRDYVAVFKELDKVTIIFQSSNGTYGQVKDVTSGTNVTTTSQTINPVIGAAKGTEAVALTGNRFVSWTGPNGFTSTNEELTAAQLERVGGSLVAGTYTANFEPFGNVTLTYQTEGATKGLVTDTNSGAEVTSTFESINPQAASTRRSTARAKAGYTFAGWYVAGTKVSDNETIQQSELLTDANGFATAVYEARFTESGNVTISYRSSSATMGSVDPASETIAPASVNIAVGSTADPNDGYEFVNWTLSGVEVSRELNFKPEKEATAVWTTRTYTANFKEIDKVTITYESSDATLGLVRHVTSGTNVSSTNEQINPENGTPTGSTATATAGNRFVKWTGPNNFESTNPVLSPAQITQVGNAYTTRTYVAHFEPLTQVTLSYKTADSNMGLVTDTVNTTSEVQSTSETINPATGSPVRSTAKAKAGYQFVNWTGPQGFTSTNETLLQSELLRDGDGNYISAEYTANFKSQSDVTITYRANNTAMGTVDPASVSVAPAATTVQGATATAGDGYEFVEWRQGTASGAVVGDSESFTPTRPGAVWTDITYVAIFREKTAVTITYESSDSTLGLVRHVTNGTNVATTSESINPDIGTPTGSTATATAGNRFIKWTGPNGFESTNPVLSSAEILKANGGGYTTRSYVAHFEAIPSVTLTYRTDDRDMGLVTEGAGSATEVTTTSESINPQTGTPARSTAKARAGYAFVNWTGPNGFTSTNETLLQSELLKDASGYYINAEYVAHFRSQDEVTLSYRSSNTAWGTVNPASQSLPPAATAANSVTATANPGYDFVEWRQGTTTGPVVGDNEVFTPTKTGAVWTNVTYVAIFREKTPVTITYESGDSSLGLVRHVSTGSNVPTTTESINPVIGIPTGSTATALSGSRFVKWVGPDGFESTNPQLPASAIALVGGVYTTRTYVAQFEKLTDVTLTYKTANSTMGQVTDVDTPTSDVDTTSETINPGDGQPEAFDRESEGRLHVC